MASAPKQLRIVRTREAGPVTRLLDVECIDGPAFADIGGKYVIVHTGRVVDSKPVKRAYSLIPAEEGRATLAVKRLDGPGSSALHDAAMGTTLSFSGPWGKLLPDPGTLAQTLIVATDTGITSALSIVENAVPSGNSPLEVLWLHEPREDFFGLDAVHARMTRAGVRFTTATLPPVASAERSRHAWPIIEERALSLRPEYVVASGDGAIVHPLRARLPERVPGLNEVRVECFFHNPEKKIA